MSSPANNHGDLGWDITEHNNSPASITYETLVYWSVEQFFDKFAKQRVSQEERSRATNTKRKQNGLGCFLGQLWAVFCLLKALGAAQ